MEGDRGGGALDQCIRSPDLNQHRSALTSKCGELGHKPPSPGTAHIHRVLQSPSVSCWALAIVVVAPPGGVRTHCTGALPSSSSPFLFVFVSSLLPGALGC